MLYIPKLIALENAKLMLIYYFLLASALTFLAAKVVVWDELKVDVSVARHIRPSIWVQSNATELLEFANTQLHTQSYCTNPGKYDYWYDSSDLWKFENHTCMPLCCQVGKSTTCNTKSAAWPAQSCIHERGTYIKESQTSVVLISEMRNQDLNTGATVCYFLPTLEGHKVGLSYSFSIPDTNWWFRTPPEVPGSITHLDGVSRTNVSTVVLMPGASGENSLKEWKSFRPGEEILMSLQELLMLAGESGTLDTVDDRLGANMMPGTDAAGPHVRVAGMTLSLEIACYNFDLSRHVQGVQPGRDTGVCYITLERDAPTWVQMERAESDRYAELNGIRIHARGGGYFQFYSWYAIWLAFAAAYVLLGIPREIVRVGATHMLGHLSTIYNRVIYEPFNIGVYIGSVCTRLMTSSSAFGSFEENRSISKAAMVRHISEMAVRYSDRPVSRAFLLTSTKSQKTSVTAEAMHQSQTEFHRASAVSSFASNRSAKSVAGAGQKVASFAVSCASCCRLWRKYCMSFTPQLDQDEIHSMVNFWHLAVVDPDAIRSHDSPLALVRKCFSNGSQEEWDDMMRDAQSKSIDRDHYLSATMQSDALGFEDLLTFFDSDRPVSCLEHMFMPRFLRLMVNGLRDHRTRGRMSCRDEIAAMRPVIHPPTSSVSHLRPGGVSAQVVPCSSEGNGFTDLCSSKTPGA